MNRFKSYSVCIYIYIHTHTHTHTMEGFLGSSAGKESACNAGDSSSIPGLGRSPGEGIGYQLQYSWVSLVSQMIIYLQCVRLGFNPWVGKIPWTRSWQPTPVFLPGESLWTELPGGLQSMGSQKVGHSWATKCAHVRVHTHTHTHTHTQDYYSVIKNEEILPFVTIWMELEGIFLSEISQK